MEENKMYEILTKKDLEMNRWFDKHTHVDFDSPVCFSLNDDATEEDRKQFEIYVAEILEEKRIDEANRVPGEG